MVVVATAAVAEVHPLYGMGTTVSAEWFSASDEQSDYLAIDSMGSLANLQNDTVVYAASSAGALTVSCFVDEEHYDKQIYDFLSIAFTARLLLNRAVVSGAVEWRDVVAEKHLVVSTAPSESATNADTENLASTIDEQVRTARLHVNSPFAGSIFGDTGTDVVLADTFETMTVVLAESRSECENSQLPAPALMRLARGDCGSVCTDIYARIRSLDADMEQINFDFHGTAASGLVRLAVADATRLYKTQMDRSTDSDNINDAALMSVHASAVTDATRLLGELLTGSGVLLVLAQEELTSRVTEALSSYTFEQRVAQTRLCSDFGEHSRDEFARKLAHSGMESAPQDQLLRIAREAVSKHLDSAAEKRILEACPLRDDSFLVHVYSRVSDLIGSGMLNLKETMLDVSAAQSRQYRAMLERATESNPRLSHEELYVIHKQALAGCKDAFQQHFGRYRDRTDVETHRHAMLVNVRDIWEAIDRRNNESIADMCERSAEIIAKRYASYIDNIYEQVGRGTDISATRDSMRNDATATYTALVAKYSSNVECRAAGATIASEIRRLHSEFRSTKDSSDLGRIMWSSERLVVTVFSESITVLSGVSALLQKNAIGIVIGFMISMFSVAVYIATSTRRRRETTLDGVPEVGDGDPL